MLQIAHLRPRGFALLLLHAGIHINMGFSVTLPSFQQGAVGFQSTLTICLYPVSLSISLLVLFLQMALTIITKGFRDDISNAAPLNTGPTVPLDAEFIDLTGCGDEPITPLQGSRLNLELHQSVPPLYADESLNRIWDEMFLPEYLSPGPEQNKGDFPPYGGQRLKTTSISLLKYCPVSSDSNSTVSSTSPSPDDTAASEDINLGKVLEVFPDISYDYVNELFTIEKERPQPPDVVTDITERIIEEILHQLPYPKQKDLKRKRNASEPDANEPRWEIGPDDANDPVYSHRALVSLPASDTLAAIFLNPA